MKNKKLSVVIPAYNEEKNLEILYEKLKSVLDRLKHEYELIFVDDGSTDKTFEVLEKLHKKDKRVKVIKFKKNFGQSAAMRAGFDYAHGDIIISMDADLQNDPNDIPALLNELNKGYDVVCGWRYKRKDSLSKKIFSKFANFLRNHLTNEKVHDSGCTLRAYKKECVKDLELFGEMHRYIPALLLWKGYKIGEVKVNHHPRKYGKTKYGYKRILRGFLDLLLITFWQKYSFRPMHIFGTLGIFSVIVGFLGGFYSIYLKIFKSVDLSDTALPLFAVFMVMIGIQFIISGLLADITIKNYYSNERKNYLVERVVE